MMDSPYRWFWGEIMIFNEKQTKARPHMENYPLSK